FDMTLAGVGWFEFVTIFFVTIFGGRIIKDIAARNPLDARGEGEVNCTFASACKICRICRVSISTVAGIKSATIEEV
ncbi:MAG: hypothetical protein II180_06930, partial [Proteobacteria bacterium]|nr:hypothetical protein [Pseudomonadota bacterium]